MKIITSSNNKIALMSKTEWEKIGKCAGWMHEESRMSKLKEAVSRCKDTTICIIEALENAGFSAREVTSTNNSICIESVVGKNKKNYPVNIEIRPWANRNNKKFELRGGIIIMAGPYSHKKFKRKRFSPNNIDKLSSFLKETFKYSDYMEKLRKKRSENRLYGQRQLHFPKNDN